MRQQLGEQSVKKRQKMPIKIQSFLLRSLESQVEGYHALTQQTPNDNENTKGSKARLLPVISRKGRIALPPPALEQPLFGRKQPKLSSILHYRSQKLLQAVKAREEEEHYLYKGLKKFAIEVVKLNHQNPEKQTKSGRYSLPSVASNQPETGQIISSKLIESPAGPKKSSLKSLAVPKKRKQFYLQLNEPQTLSGWNTQNQEFDAIH